MEYAIHTLLARTAHVQQNAMRPYLQKLGLTTGQPKVLRCLAMNGPCSQRMLADYCEVDPAVICRMLDPLERSGFLTRKQSQKDRRQGEVALTEKGKATFAAWEEEYEKFESRMLAGFSDEERKALAGFLKRAYRNVGGRLL